MCCALDRNTLQVGARVRDHFVISLYRALFSIGWCLALLVCLSDTGCSENGSRKLWPSR
ncbi:hypothetical protein BDV27DRAFT_138514 [Aspergillus caelatus]|uniref:Uncharacterized protein n=1 Tax=Aspergillus caelatus TaxID=61420 RepID=A0A5N6ZJV7_9EURO|nr:uncharacterized protein BDV27DRAFT_138514 [Aspergillus caelatus]KAE8357911.1 hypothetical protein BDV27DRAFT_138514 [Aspergillus caelatus]